MANSLRVAVITPYYRETLEVLRQCQESVRAQTYACTHFLVADGHAQDAVAGWPVEHVVLPRPHQDIGDTPRCIGSLSAMNQGFDAIAFLDADNWYYPQHIETMVKLHQATQAVVCTATRSLHRLDGSQLYVDRQECDGKNHVDTNCMFLTRPAFRVIPLWGMIPRELSWYGDRIFFQSVLARGLRTAHHGEPTVAYRTPHAVHYRNVGEAPPAGAKTHEDFAGSLRWWRSLPDAVQADWSSFFAGAPGWVIDIGDVVKARRAVQTAVETTPHPGDAAEENNRGVQFLAAGDFMQAEAAFRRALQLAPDLPEVSFNIGKALQAQGRLADAAPFYQRAVSLRPSWAEAHFHLGFLYFSMRNLTDAEAEYCRVIELVPDHVDALNSLGANIFNNEGRIEEARTAYRQVLALDPKHANCHSNLLLNEQYAAGVSLESLAELHADWERRHAEPLRSTWRPFPNTRDPERQLRIGFMGGDFFLHPVGFFLAPVLERLDPKQWFTICYANQRQNDEMTRRLRRDADLWHLVHDLNAEAMAERVREDAVDLLIDVAGHTGRNCLLTFARRPAPVQFTWAGYVGTTGLSAIDYVIADRFQIAEGAEKYFREQVLRLPGDYICYEPPAYAPAVGPLPAKKNGFVTFGCLNNTAKVGQAVIALWAEIMRRVPGSRLVMKYHWLDDAGLRRRLTDQFAAHGIEAERLQFAGATSHNRQLDSYNQIDLALDPFPYSGGLTTCEACWMGVPVITCPGDTFASRHSLSHLSNIGLTETIARDRSEYADLAVRLAGDLDHLAELRAGLRPRMESSPLCDADRFTEQLAAALRGTWRAWCAAG